MLLLLQPPAVSTYRARKAVAFVVAVVSFRGWVQQTVVTPYPFFPFMFFGGKT